MVKQQQPDLKHVDVVLDIEPNILIFAYETKMSQVLLNLFLNALDAIEDVDAPKVTFNLFTDNKTKVVLDIIDNGHGIPQKTCRIYLTLFSQPKTKALV